MEGGGQNTTITKQNKRCRGGKGGRERETDRDRDRDRVTERERAKNNSHIEIVR